MLDTLAAQTRLAVFRYLVSHEPCGKTIGEIAVAMQCPQDSASGHLAILARAQLVTCTRQGRTVVYRADPSGMRWLLQYLLADCCNGTLQRARPSYHPYVQATVYIRKPKISIGVDIKSVA